MKPVLISTALLLCSCTTLKFAVNEKIIPKENCASLGNYILPFLQVNLEGKDCFFLVDTGATGTVLTDSTAIDNFESKKFAAFGSNVSANGHKNKNRFFTAKVASPLFESDNKLMLYTLMPKAFCSKQSTLTGIIGLDVFFEDETALFLNFSKNEICTLNKSDFSNYSSQNFKLIPSECKNNQIFVFVEIEGKLFRFKLDTGFSGNMIIPDSEKAQFDNPNKMVLEGTLYGTVSSMTLGVETLYEKMPILFAGEKVDSKVNVSSSIKSQNIGFQFMKGFDWLIDYNNNKVYVKRNNHIIESNFDRKVSYYSRANSSDLVITTKEKSKVKYQLGDKITTVNGQKITPENICEYQELLNKSEDWDALNLEVTTK